MLPISVFLLFLSRLPFYFVRLCSFIICFLSCPLFSETFVILFNFFLYLMVISEVLFTVMFVALGFLNMFLSTVPRLFDMVKVKV